MVTVRTYVNEVLPPLESGDRLTSTEFERRYGAMPEVKKAELIEGVVFMPSPVSLEHSAGHNAMATWLGTYAAKHPGISAHSDGSVRLDIDNQFQPDVFLRRDTGTSTTGERGLLDGPPELVVEVAASSVSRDLYEKKHVYRRAGVREYVVWRVLDGDIDWFELRDGEYLQRTPDADGIIECAQFPGLRLNVRVMLAGELATVLAAVR